MDDRGYWHTSSQESEMLKSINEEIGSLQLQGPRRVVMEMEIGSTVEVFRGQDKMLAVFEAAEKNKVTLRPIDEAGKIRPYFETAERVMLSNGTGRRVQAQVWDTRNGKLILRTLPV